MKKKLRRLGTDVLWITAGQMISTIAMLATMKVWAVYLEPAELGLMALVIGAASIAVGIMLRPLFQAILVGYTEHSQKGHALQFRVVSGNMVRNRVIQVAFAILIIGSPVAWLLELHWATVLMVVGMFAFESYRYYEQMLFAAARRQREVAMITSGDIVFRLASVWFLLHVFEANSYTAIMGNLLGAFLFVATMRLGLRLEAFTNAKIDVVHGRQAIRDEINQLARPLLPSMILANLTEMGNRYFIGATLGLEAAGLFVVSYGFVKRPYGMLNNVGEMVMTPILKGAIAKKARKETTLSRLYWLTFVALFSTVGAALFSVLSEPLVSLFLSQKYADAADMLAGLAVAIALFNISNVFNWFSITMGNSRAVFLNNLVGSSTTVVLTIFLCLTLGISGVVWALIIGYSLQLITSILTFLIYRTQHWPEF